MQLRDPPPPGDYRVALTLTAPGGREARHHLRVVTLRRLSRTEARREARHFERRSRVQGLALDLRRCERAGARRFTLPGRAGRAPPRAGPRRVRRRLDRAAAARRPAQPRARGAAGVPEARARAMRALLVALALLVVLPAAARAGEPDATAPAYDVELRGSDGGFRWQGRETIAITNPGSGPLGGDRRPALGQRRARLRAAALGRDLQPRGRRARRPDAPELHRGAGEARRADRSRRAGERRLRRRHPRAAPPARPLRPRRQGRRAALQRHPRDRASRGRAVAARPLVRRRARRGRTRRPTGGCG